MIDPSLEIVSALNRECDCTLTDMAALHRQIDAQVAVPGQSIVESHPHLFSEAPVFLQRQHARKMQRIIEAVHAIVQLPDYQRAVLATAAPIARIDQATEGVFLGFDFHISPDGPKLIEINTNAGGALLNIAAREAQTACCAGVEELPGRQPAAAELEQTIFDMFTREWRRARRARPLRSIAIVDDNPPAQYLYPEFLLARKLFEARGIEAFVVDPSELAIGGEGVRANGRPVDLIYNRLTDFYFEDPRHQVLREAYERDLAVLTPHPRAHALYSNKQNLTLLSDAARLREIGASSSDAETLATGIPRTLAVEGNQERWWTERKKWFFKPMDGFGSRGTYRGDKLTRRVFAEVMKGRYVAQELTPPSERLRTVNGDKQAYKLDIRCYVYAGETQLMAARLYRGQTTNFRTAGGGFSPVFVIGSALP